MRPNCPARRCHPERRLAVSLSDRRELRISPSGGTQPPAPAAFAFVPLSQAAFVRDDACAALVTTTDGYDYSDKWHYDTAGYIDLGRQFAEALAGLETPAD